MPENEPGRPNPPRNLKQYPPRNLKQYPPRNLKSSNPPRPPKSRDTVNLPPTKAEAKAEARVKAIRKAIRNWII